MSSRVAFGFNFIAPFYTFLSRLIFGKNLDAAQLFYLDQIKPDDHILILGGGSGSLLQSLLTRNPKLRIDYIDISSNMLELAKQKAQHTSTINFILGTERNIPKSTYSVVITNFYLDMFTDNSLNRIINTIKVSLSKNATWLAVDFVSEKWWQKVLLWIMYRFFKIVTGIEARQLPNWTSSLLDEGLVEISNKRFFRGFIKAAHLKLSAKA